MSTPPSLFEQRWPLRLRTPPTGVMVAVLASGVAAAIAVPLDRPGVGWLIAGLVFGGGLIAVALRAGHPTGPALTAQRIGWGLATLALIGVGAVRAADWLFVLCLMTAVLTAILAVSDGRTPTGVLLSVFWFPTAVVRGVAWVVRGAQPPSRGGGAGRMVVAVIVTVVLLLVFGGLFASADPAFANVMSAILPDISVTTPIRWAFLFIVFSLAAAGALFLVVNPHTFGAVILPAARPLRRAEWALPVGALVALFAVFVAVQFTVLFGDRDYVMETAGLTFADYARSGFGQLVAVTILTLGVIAVTLRKAPRASAGDRAVLRVLLGALSLCTLVVVGSALSRMWLYEQEYGFTRLRIFVSAFELWLGLVFVLLIVAGVRLRGAWLIRTVLAAGVLTLLGLAVLNPDRFIAEQNVDRWAKTGRIDGWYLRHLSADAAPELDRLPDRLRACTLGRIHEDLKEPDDWREFNLGRYRARQIAPIEGGSVTDCVR